AQDERREVGAAALLVATLGRPARAEARVELRAEPERHTLFEDHRVRVLRAREDQPAIVDTRKERQPADATRRVPGVVEVRRPRALCDRRNERSVAAATRAALRIGRAVEVLAVDEPVVV